MTFVQSPLPFDRHALEPHMSALTLGCHYDQHHRGYVATLNTLTQGTKFEEQPLWDIIVETAGKPQWKALFQCAAQSWNHEFFWNSMSAPGGPKLGGELHDRVAADFGSIETFELEFVDAATKLFGSGWVWLVEQDGRLKIVATENAMPPIAANTRAILVCDIWEHAYYLDHYSDRKAFVQIFLTHLANWDMALVRLK